LNAFEESLEDLNTALNTNPLDSLALLSRGEIYYSLGRYEESLAGYNRILKLGIDHAPIEILKRRAHTYISLGNFEMALSDLKSHSIYTRLNDKNKEFFFVCTWFC